MGKIILWLLLALLGVSVCYILLLSIAALLVNPEKEYTHDSPFYRKLLYSATACAIRLLHIRIQTDGMEKVPTSGRFLLVCNHRSNFDPILTWYILRKYNLAFVSKPENFHIPIFGRLIRRCCFLAIDRENPKNALVTIQKAAELLERDEVNVAIYPEGTRSKDCVLLPFHNGVFKIAQKANVPILVAAIQGTEQIHKNWYRRRTQVQFDIIETIPAAFVAENRTAVIGQRVLDDLNQGLREKGERHEKLHDSV